MRLISIVMLSVSIAKKQRSVMCGACPLGTAFDVIEALPSAQQWIPASERLPEEPFGCIVSYHGFMLTPHGEREYDAIFPELLWFDGYGWNNSEGECVDNMIDVTAWMPLPEPWKEGNDE